MSSKFCQQIRSENVDHNTETKFNESIRKMLHRVKPCESNLMDFKQATEFSLHQARLR